MWKLLVLCVFFNAVLADPEPNLKSLVTAPFKYIVRWLKSSYSKYFNKNDRYYHYNRYNEDNGWHHFKKRSVPDNESTDTGLPINDYITPSIAKPLDYSGVHLKKKSSMNTVDEENEPESNLRSLYASISVQEENLVYDSYSPFNYFENNLKYDVKRKAEDKEHTD